MMNLVILIPCKNLDRGKSRLAACLSPRARRALCEFFLCRTLDVATRAVAPACVRVVTSDPRAAAIAAEYGAGAIPDGGADLNGALARGREQVLAEAGDCAGLILPTDLPLATPAALAGVAHAAHAIVSDEGGGGTNVLRLGPAAFRTFRFAFGPLSFAKHRATARTMGLRVRIAENPLLMFDVDTPAQYRRWISGEAS
jgi:2-phospho-L-lactate/phosphoenolpyruvate guanylyltransferase